MDLTPLAHLSDEEFMAHLSTKESPSVEEVEAMLRIERLLDEIEDLLATQTVGVEEPVRE